MRALGEGRPLGMVHIDAHCDTSGEYEGAKFHHGGPFRQAVLDGVLDPERCIQIGIRGAGEYLWEFSQESRSEGHTSELQSLMRLSYAVFCLKKKTKHNNTHNK